VLRTGIFALTAFDAVRRFSFASGRKSVIHLRACLISVHEFKVHGVENVGDIYFLRTFLRAVMTGSARYARKAFDDPAGLRDSRLLLFIQRSEILHKRNVVLHLINIRHSRKHCQHTIERRRKSDCPGSRRCLRIYSPQTLPLLHPVY